MEKQSLLAVIILAFYCSAISAKTSDEIEQGDKCSSILSTLKTFNTNSDSKIDSIYNASLLETYNTLGCNALLETLCYRYEQAPVVKKWSLIMDLKKYSKRAVSEITTLFYERDEIIQKSTALLQDIFFHKN